MAHLCAVLGGIAITWASAGIGLMTLMTHTCIGAFDCPGPKLRTARQRVGEVVQGITQFMIEAQRCPTSSELRASRNVSERSLVDPWGEAIVFSCSGEKVKVTSAGRDGIFGTFDDVTGGD